MKIIVLVIICFFQIWGESLSDINTKTRQSNQSISSTSSQTYRSNNNGGYKTEVHIIGSEKKFDRVRFSEPMFRSWLILYVEAQTFDLIDQLKEGGYVNRDGTLKSNVAELNLPLTPGHIIDKSKLNKYYAGKYTEKWIRTELIRVGVLDAKGFLTNTTAFSDTFNEKDFNQYLAKIKKINFKFSLPVISEELGKDLLQFIKESSLTIFVTQEETTRYQSTKEGFWENFKDQLGGSFLGSIFYQDKIKTVKRKIRYIPDYNVLTLFSNIYYGFGQSTYADGALGDIRFFGLKEQQNATFHYAKNNSNIEHIGGEFTFLKSLKNNQYWRENLNSVGYGFNFDELRDAAGSYSWMSAQLIQASFVQNGSSYLSFGLANFNSSFQGGSRLGINFGLEGDLHLMQYLGLYAGVDTNFGVNLFASEGAVLNWEVSHCFLGLQTGANQFKLRGGYEWVFVDKVKAFENFSTSISYYF